jgi:hypothetical protein
MTLDTTLLEKWVHVVEHERGRPKLALLGAPNGSEGAERRHECPSMPQECPHGADSFGRNSAWHSPHTFVMASG